MSSSERKEQYEKYLSAVNEQKIEELLTFYDNDCEVKAGHQTVAKGIEEIRSAFNPDLSGPKSSYEIIEYLPVDNDDQIRVHLKSNDNKHLDATYSFSKENPQKFIQVVANSIEG